MLNDIVEFAKELELDNQLIYKISQLNYRKINNLSLRIQNNNPRSLSVQNDITRLAVILDCAVKIKEKYDLSNIDEKIYYDTMSDIKIWCENNNNKGLKNYNWLVNHINFNLFRIGRLQYQFYTINNPLLNYNRLPIKNNEKVIYIHIPQGEKLDYDLCVESLKQSKVFFKNYFESYIYSYYFCESWLLFEDNNKFMDKNSNILKFQTLFDDIYSFKDDYQAIERIFGKRKVNAKLYSENTMLQKNAKNYILNGNNLGMGIGIIRSDKYE